jgi:hypothetical protein
MDENAGTIDKAWTLFLDTTGTTTEVVAAEITRLAMTAALVAFYREHFVPRGSPQLSSRTFANIMSLRGEVPQQLKVVIDNAIIAGYHSVLHSGSYSHHAASEHLSNSLSQLKQSISDIAHLKKPSHRHH